MIFSNLYRRKGRTLLTTFGIAVGVAAVIALGAMADGFVQGYAPLSSGSGANLAVYFAVLEPGDATVYHGDTLRVSADVDGLAEDEEVTLYYSTVDGQVVDRALTMTRPKDGARHEAALPPEPGGVQQDVMYYLAAGDCKTVRFRVDAQIAPAIAVERVEYDYPAYTGLSNRQVENQGDVRGIEGTRVIVRATANRPIRRAEIDLDCDDRRG